MSNRERWGQCPSCRGGVLHLTVKSMSQVRLGCNRCAFYRVAGSVKEVLLSMSEPREPVLSRVPEGKLDPPAPLGELLGECRVTVPGSRCPECGGGALIQEDRRGRFGSVQHRVYCGGCDYNVTSVSTSAQELVQRYFMPPQPQLNLPAPPNQVKNLGPILTSGERCPRCRRQRLQQEELRGRFGTPYYRIYCVVCTYGVTSEKSVQELVQQYFSRGADGDLPPFSKEEKSFAFVPMSLVNWVCPVCGAPGSQLKHHVGLIYGKHFIQCSACAFQVKGPDAKSVLESFIQLSVVQEPAPVQLDASVLLPVVAFVLDPES
jgi:ssDNA-binding Zn-finger/Zn-ribbon topoisomerase 1